MSSTVGFQNNTKTSLLFYCTDVENFSSANNKQSVSLQVELKFKKHLVKGGKKSNKTLCCSTAVVKARGHGGIALCKVARRVMRYCLTHSKR